jgi:peptidoglycan hydrolase-like protein with peptidoglycan-binding domain
MGSRRLRYGVAGMITAMVGTAMITFAAPAAAATLPLCNTWSEVVRSGRTLAVPTAKTSTSCHIGRDYAANTSVVESFQSIMRRCYPKLNLASPYSKEQIGHLELDGSFGPRTEAALRAIQSHIGTDDDGIYGPNTRDRMKFPRPATADCYQY